MPNSNVYLDGPQETISRDGTFTAQHIYTPIQGVAIQINAFNFPCWGMLEKLAPQLLAGVPVIVKPASQTAFLTELMVKHIIESGILPEGSLQLVCGSTGDLLKHVDCQDAVSFTGSASTGLMLKQQPAIVQNATRFFMEADSLNCSILGSDVQPESVEFDLYVKEVAREMTAKAGQKCTAIRRAIVPANLMEAVGDALKARLAKIAVGDPDVEGVRMGALAGLDQRRDVEERLELLSQQCEKVFGDFGAGSSLSVMGENTENGAFMSPVLLAYNGTANDPDSAIHNVEAFGPVSTLIPYENDDDAIAIAAMGKGSLVGSVITADPGSWWPGSCGWLRGNGRYSWCEALYAAYCGSRLT